jgi:cytochrome c553
MKRSMTWRLPLAFALTMSAATTMAAGNAQEGEIKARACTGCHGVPGYYNVYPTYHVPKVGGQKEKYIVSALQAYKSGDRSHSTMQAHAESLSDRDIADIAAYFASFKDKN